MGATSFSQSGVINYAKYRSVLAGNEGFKPFPIPGVEPDLWLDASDASTITETGGSVSQWANKGSLSNLSQATAALQPTTGVTTINGLNVIDFDSDGLVSEGAKSQWTFLHDGTDYFIAYVIKVGASQPDSLSSLFATRNYSGEDRGIAFYMNNSGSEFVYNIATGTSTVIDIDAAALSSGNQILSAILDPDNGTSSERIDYFVNNTQGGDTNSTSGSPSSSDSAVNFEMGIRTSQTDIPFIGSYAEVIIVSGADATETNRQTIVTYLNDKWGIF